MGKLQFMENLYNYQKEAVDWLTKRGGGLLLDEPGLGKTRQAIVTAKRLGGTPILIVCPNSVKRWFKREILQVYPDARVAVASTGGRFDGEHNLDQLFAIGLVDFFIVHYTGLRMNTDEFKGVRWSTVILDECHYVKNRKAQRSEAVMEVTPKMAYRIGLTATPYGKDVSDLWHQLHWLVPENQFLNSYWRFYNRFVQWEQGYAGNRTYKKIIGIQNKEQLAKLMNALCIRRTKKEVAKDLPPLTKTPLPLEPTDGQLQMYRELKKAGVEKEIGNTRMLVVNALARMTRMEQVLSHPWIYDMTEEGSKLEWLKLWMESNKDSFVVVTRFKQSAEYIARNVLETDEITGDVPEKWRDSIVEKWRKEGGGLIGTIGCLGTGINLQEASTMICYDVLHDPVQMEQVTHRIYRINTDHPVEVIYLYNEDTTNEIAYRAFRDRMSEIEMVRLLMKHLEENGE